MLFHLPRPDSIPSSSGAPAARRDNRPKAEGRFCASSVPSRVQRSLRVNTDYFAITSSLDQSFFSQDVRAILLRRSRSTENTSMTAVHNVARYAAPFLISRAGPQPFLNIVGNPSAPRVIVVRQEFPPLSKSSPHSFALILDYSLAEADDW